MAQRKNRRPQSDPVTAVDDRRSAERQSVNTEAFLWLPDVDRLDGNSRLNGTVLDRSDGGIAILVPATGRVRFRSEVGVEEGGEVRTAIVLNVAEQDEQERIGLAWTD